MVKMVDNPNPISPMLFKELEALERLKHKGFSADEFAQSFGHARMVDGVERLVAFSHGVSYLSGWHHDAKTGEPIERNTGEMIALMHSELSEAMEADRKGLMDDKLPHRLGIEVELADLLHRVFDFAGRNRLDIAGAYYEKARYNATREDHKPENRLKEGGKAY